MTQTALADQLGVTQPAVAQMEAGLIQPTDSVLDSLSHVTGFPGPFFQQPPPPEFPLGSLLYRARASVTAREKTSTARFGQLMLELSRRLTQRVRLPALRLPQLVDELPEEAAAITRATMGLASDTPLPNLIRTLEKNGVIVFALPQNLELPKQDAFSAWTSDSPVRPLMVLAHRAHPGALRMSVAHELGHLVMHQAPRGSISQLESEAFRFASEFLMPEQAMRDEIERPVTLTGLMQLRDRWGVSVQALVHRAQEMEVITARQARNLYHQATLRGWGREDPGGRMPERPRALLQMAEMVYSTTDLERHVSAAMAWPPVLAAHVLSGYATNRHRPDDSDRAPKVIELWRNGEAQ